MTLSARSARVFVCFLTLFSLVACGGGGSSNSGSGGSQNSSNPVPSLISINPASVPAGSSAMTITVTGSNFVSSSVIEWNSVAVATSYMNATTLTGEVSAGGLQNAGTASVTVMNPTPGGGTSTALSFVIGSSTSNPAPSLISISPASASVGSSAITITLTGSNFVPSSFIEWNNIGVATSYVIRQASPPRSMLTSFRASEPLP